MTSEKKSLHQIGIETGTDKAGYHNFCQLYDNHLNKFRNSEIKLLEVGILKQSSIKMWREYFQLGTIHGIDIEKINPTIQNVTYHKVDTDNCDELINFSKSESNWDIIIDDGGHTMRQQQNALKILWPHLKSGGVFVMEDLHTSFMTKARYNNENVPTTFDLIKSFQEKKQFNSKFMDEFSCKNILNELENVIIWWKGMESNKDASTSGSITSLLFKKLQCKIYSLFTMT
jgi:hypothetical protein